MAIANFSIFTSRLRNNLPSLEKIKKISERFFTNFNVHRILSFNFA